MARALLVALAVALATPGAAAARDFPAAGYYPRFGFFSYDPGTLARHERPSARLFRRITRFGTLPSGH